MKYFLGELSDAERDGFEEHYFGCPECAQAVRSIASFVEAAKPVLAPAEPAAGAPTPSPAPLRWRTRHPVQMAAGLAVVSLLGATAYQGLVTIPRLSAELRETNTLRSVPFYPLTVSRGETPTIVVSQDDRWVLFALSQGSDRSYPTYRCQVQDATGRVVQPEVLLHPHAKNEELEVLVAVRGLPAGTYALVVTGVPETSSAPATSGAQSARYVFTLDRR